MQLCVLSVLLVLIGSSIAELALKCFSLTEDSFVEALERNSGPPPASGLTETAAAASGPPQTPGVALLPARCHSPEETSGNDS